MWSQHEARAGPGWRNVQQQSVIHQQHTAHTAAKEHSLQRATTAVQRRTRSAGDLFQAEARSEHRAVARHQTAASKLVHTKSSGAPDLLQLDDGQGGPGQQCVGAGEEEDVIPAKNEVEGNSIFGLFEQRVGAGEEEDAVPAKKVKVEGHEFVGCLRAS